MMNYQTFGNGAVSLLVHQAGSHLPHVRFRGLHKGSRRVLLSACTYSLSANRHLVNGRLALFELRSPRKSRPLRRGVAEVAGSFGGAGVGAIVDLSSLDLLAVKQSPTDRAGKRRQLRGRVTGGSAVLFPARPRAKDKAAEVPFEAVGLDIKGALAVGAIDRHAMNSTGTGATEAVAV